MGTNGQLILRMAAPASTAVPAARAVVPAADIPCLATAQPLIRPLCVRVRSTPGCRWKPVRGARTLPRGGTNLVARAARMKVRAIVQMALSCSATSGQTRRTSACPRATVARAASPPLTRGPGRRPRRHRRRHPHNAQRRPHCRRLPPSVRMSAHLSSTACARMAAQGQRARRVVMATTAVTAGHGPCIRRRRRDLRHRSRHRHRLSGE